MCFENPCLLGLVSMFSSTPEAHIEETEILQRISTYLTIRKYMWNATRMAKSMMFLVIILVCLTSYNTLTFKCYSNIVPCLYKWTGPKLSDISSSLHSQVSSNVFRKPLLKRPRSLHRRDESSPMNFDISNNKEIYAECNENGEEYDVPDNNLGMSYTIQYFNF
jgi:hypothetical protein